MVVEPRLPGAVPQSLVMFAGVASGMLVVTLGVARGTQTVGDMVLFTTMMAQVRARGPGGPDAREGFEARGAGAGLVREKDLRPGARVRA